MARVQGLETPLPSRLPLYFLWICLLTLTQTVLCQAPSPVPSPVQEMAFARAGPLLYVQGGKFDQGGARQYISNQLYALNLSTSWANTAAPWQSLTPGDANFLFNAVATSDNQSIYTIATGANNAFSFKKYNIMTNSWDSTPFLSGTSDQIRQATRPVVDPRTGLIYLTDTNYMNIFNVMTGAMESNLIPSNALTSRRFMGSVYNAARQSIMFYGGLNSNGAVDPRATYVTEYNIGLKTWGEDGNKVVVYGGRIVPSAPATPPVDYTGTIHILDIPTAQWTEAPSGSPRLYMACIVVGDQFVAWGGSQGGGNTYTSSPVIFDLTKGKWVESYTAPAYLLNRPHPTTKGLPTGTPEPPSSSNNNLGAILGGVFGSLFVITVSALIYMFFLRRKDKVKYSTPSDQKSSAGASNDNSGSPEVLHNPPVSVMASVFNYQQSNDSQHSQPRNPQLLALKTSELDRRDLASLQMKNSSKVDGHVYALINDPPKPPAAPQQILVHNPVVTSVPTSGINYGYAPANNPLVYLPQGAYAMPAQPGSVIVSSGGQPANVMYVAHQVPPSDPSNTSLFDTTLASQGSSPLTQYDFTEAYTTRNMPLSPTTTQQVQYYVPVTTAVTDQPPEVPMSVAYTQEFTGQGYTAPTSQ
ncbi:hypothetical protein BGZ93_005071 [Podila epicladia]|nr:hypothetical protein BGZ92_010683 [Podila epicladia]KAG0096055.1 hypothetical protein BGZ93_005071 [Podila epicladia]